MKCSICSSSHSRFTKSFPVTTQNQNNYHNNNNVNNTNITMCRPTTSLPKIPFKTMNVRFEETVLIQAIATDYTDEERTSMWYNSNDYKEFRDSKRRQRKATPIVDQRWASNSNASLPSMPRRHWSKSRRSYKLTTIHTPRGQGSVKWRVEWETTNYRIEAESDVGLLCKPTCE